MALFNPLPAQLRKKLWHRIAMQLRYNVPLLVILENLSSQYKKNKALSNILDEITETFSGHGLTDALAPHIPYDELMLIQSSESNGKLYKGFELAAKTIEFKESIYASLKNAISYPALLLVIVIAIFGVVSFVLVPSLSLIAEPETWGGMAKVLYYISSFLTSFFGVLFLMALVIGIVWIWHSFANYTGKYRTMLDKLPPWNIYRLVVGSVWLFTVASLMQAGKQQKDILNNMVNSEICTPYLESRIIAILSNFGEGKSLGEALIMAETDFPDTELIRDINIYSNLPDFETKIYAIAEDYVKIGDEKIKENAKLLQAGLLFCIVGILLCIVYAYQDFMNIFQGV